MVVYVCPPVLGCARSVIRFNWLFIFRQLLIIFEPKIVPFAWKIILYYGRTVSYKVYFRLQSLFARTCSQLPLYTHAHSPRAVLDATGGRSIFSSFSTYPRRPRQQKTATATPPQTSYKCIFQFPLQLQALAGRFWAWTGGRVQYIDFAVHISDDNAHRKFCAINFCKWSRVARVVWWISHWQNGVECTRARTPK